MELMDKKVELLSPCGDFERLELALKYGADAVYLGGNAFTMRAAPKNFSDEELEKGTLLAHSSGKKVYLTVNVFPHSSSLKLLPDFIAKARDYGIDGFIIADLGVLKIAKEVAPEVDIHISTQAGIMNYLTANELYKLGAKRVVLARELSLEDIITIRKNTPPDLEIEAFVHGAMCMSFSGRCMLSQYLVARDANRGECAQPCRWGYYLMEEKREGEYFKVFEDEKGTYILNAKDMCMIEHIDKLCEAGITSFKIEGRAKSAYYVAVVTNAYRTAMDMYLKSPEGFVTPQWLVDEVHKVSHRKYCNGFYFGHPNEAQYYETGGYIRTCDIVGVVERSEDGVVYCTQRNKFLNGDTVEVLSPNKKPIEIKIDGLKLQITQ